MRTLFRSLVIGAVLATGSATIAAAAAATEPYIGTWKLDLAKSQFGNGPTPKSITRAYSVAGDSIELKLTGVGSDGKQLLQQSTFKLDGMDYAYTGRPEFDSVSTRHVDSYQYETIQKKAGKVVSTSIVTISADGKMFTQVTKRLTGNGGTTVTTAVYIRQ
jgi:hypothetical protein